MRPEAQQQAVAEPDERRSGRALCADGGRAGRPARCAAPRRAARSDPVCRPVPALQPGRLGGERWTRGRWGWRWWRWVEGGCRPGDRVDPRVGLSERARRGRREVARRRPRWPGCMRPAEEAAALAVRAAQRRPDAEVADAPVAKPPLLLPLGALKRQKPGTGALTRPRLPSSPAAEVVEADRPLCTERSWDKLVGRARGRAGDEPPGRERAGARVHLQALQALPAGRAAAQPQRHRQGHAHGVALRGQIDAVAAHVQAAGAARAAESLRRQLARVGTVGHVEQARPSPRRPARLALASLPTPSSRPSPTGKR